MVFFFFLAGSVRYFNQTRTETVVRLPFRTFYTGRSQLYPLNATVRDRVLFLRTSLPDTARIVAREQYPWFLKLFYVPLL